MKTLEILDCTIRDGGYVNNWDFDVKLVRETYRALSKSGVDYVELGYHGTEKYFDKNQYGLFRFTSRETVDKICQGIDGAAISIMVDFGKYDIADIKSYLGSAVKLIRVAFHKNKITEAIKDAEKIQGLGFKVSLNLMGYSSYNENEKQQLITLLNDTKIDYAYVADSYGSIIPDQIDKLFKPLIQKTNLRWGFHPHNNLQMAFANSLAAINSGATIVDGSVYGMGRGSGNLPTETLLSYLSISKPEIYNVSPVLNLIDRYYVKLHEKYGWGYNLPYMLSGIYGCHPSYAKDLIDRKEYDIEEIRKILEIVKAHNSIGFDKKLLESILKKGFFRKKELLNDSVLQNSKPSNKEKVEVSYRNIQPGTDFLVLGGGPTLKKYQKQIREFILRYNPIILGANYLADLFVPHYHAFSNRRRYIDYVDTVSEKSKLLISKYIPKDIIREYTNRSYEIIHYEDKGDVPFDIDGGIISSNCRTVSLLLMGVAIVMGAKRIFVAGLDGYTGFENNAEIHFYEEEDETQKREVLMDKHLGNLKYLEEIDEFMFQHGKEGIHIITPTAYTKFYKGIENYIKG